MATKTVGVAEKTLTYEEIARRRGVMDALLAGLADAWSCEDGRRERGRALVQEIVRKEQSR